jgi:hypothetical protein
MIRSVDKLKRIFTRVAHGRLEIAPNLFDGFTGPIATVSDKITRTRFERIDETQSIPGWLSARERQMLYALARWLPGDVVEIGSWCGLSTTAIARGVQESRDGTRRFQTYDLALSEASFRKTRSGIHMFMPGESQPLGTCSEEVYKREILPILRAPGSNNGELRRHITRLGLSDVVTINVGDFKKFPLRPTQFVFCDALHDHAEIEINAKHLRALLNCGSILACHDVGREASLIEQLRNQIPLGNATSVDSLYIAEAI